MKLKVISRILMKLSKENILKNYSQKKRETNLYEFPWPFSYFQGNIYYTYIIPHHTRGWHIWKSRGFSLFTQKCCSHQGKKKGKWAARQIFTRRLGHQKRVEVSVYIFDNEGFLNSVQIGSSRCRIYGVACRVNSDWKKVDSSDW